jgi:methionyl-tRNA synthetase
MKILKEWILVGRLETNVYGQVKSWIDGGLEPRAVTRDLDWGDVPLKVPKENMSGLMHQLATFLLPKNGLCEKEKIGNLLEDGHKVGSLYRERQYRFPLHHFPAMLKAEGSYICQTTFLRMSS